MSHKLFVFSPLDAGKWHLDLKNGSGSAGKGESPDGSDITFIMSEDMFVKMFAGKVRAECPPVFFLLNTGLTILYRLCRIE